jgi:hypothetical protein
VSETNESGRAQGVAVAGGGEPPKNPYTLRAWAREAGQTGHHREQARLECAADWLENEPWPLGGHHTVIARMQTDAVARHLSLFVERHLHDEPVTAAERDAAIRELSQVGYRATWDGEREHPAHPGVADV